MPSLLYGDNQTALRNHLNAVKSNFSGEVLTIDAPTALPEKVIQSLESSSLFSSEAKLVIIEGLLANKTLLETLPQLSTNSEIILVEEKLPTKTQLASLTKVIPNLTPLEFKLDQIVFKFFDALEPGAQKKFLPLWHSYKSQEAAEVVLVMLSRQFRLLLLAKQSDAQLSPDWSRLSPWQQQKLSRQSSSFSEAKLKALLSQLSQIDYDTKTSQSSLNLGDSLELLLLNL